MRMVGVLGLAVALTLPAGLAAGCGPGTAAGDGRVRIVAAFYPLQYVAEKVGGDRVRVTNLVQPGAEPHDLELSPQQVAGIADADLVLYLHGFQPSVDEAVAQEARDSSLDATGVVPLLDSVEGGGKDPHVWLDPTRLTTIVDAVADRLAAIDPANGTGYHDRAAALDAALATVDGEYASGLHTCQRRQIVTSHASFGYLAQRYGLTQIPITGLSPEVEPTPQHLAEAAEAARRSGATTIFFETLVSPKVAQSVADTIGARTAVLDPIEGLEPGSSGDYLTVMRANLASLKPALGCA